LKQPVAGKWGNTNLRMQIKAIDRGALSSLNERSFFLVAEARAYSSDFFTCSFGEGNLL